MATFTTNTIQAPVEGAKAKNRFTITSVDPLTAGQGITLQIGVGDSISYTDAGGGDTHAQVYAGLLAAINAEKIANPSGDWADYDYNVTDNGTSLDIEAKYGGSDAVSPITVATANGLTYSEAVETAHTNGTPQINYIDPLNVNIGDSFSVTIGSTTLTHVAITAVDSDVVTAMTTLINNDRIANPNGDFGFPAPYQSIGVSNQGLIAIDQTSYIELIGASQISTPTVSGGTGFTQTSAVVENVTNTYLNNLEATTLSKALSKMGDLAYESITIENNLGLGKNCKQKDKMNCILIGINVLTSYNELTDEEMERFLGCLGGLVNDATALNVPILSGTTIIQGSPSLQQIGQEFLPLEGTGGATYNSPIMFGDIGMTAGLKIFEATGGYIQFNAGTLTMGLGATERVELATDGLLYAKGFVPNTISAINSATGNVYTTKEWVQDYVTSDTITNDIIPRGTGTGVEDGTWSNVGNDIIPTVDGANIGNASFGVGTIYMASTIDYGSDLDFINSSTTRFTVATGGILTSNTTSAEGATKQAWEDTAFDGYARMIRSALGVGTFFSPCLSLESSGTGKDGLGGFIEGRIPDAIDGASDSISAALTFIGRRNTNADLENAHVAVFRNHNTALLTLTEDGLIRADTQTIAKIDTGSVKTLTTKEWVQGQGLTDFTGNGNWKVFYSNGSGAITELTVGASGTFLGGNGVTAAPTWQTPAVSLNGIFSAGNDGGTVPAAFDVALTDTINFDASTFIIDGGANTVSIGGTSSTNWVFGIDGSLTYKNVDFVQFSTANGGWLGIGNGNLTNVSSASLFDVALGRNILGGATYTTSLRNIGIGNIVFDGASYNADRNIGIGTSVGTTHTTGDNSVFIGNGIGTGLTTGSENIAIGRNIDSYGAAISCTIAMGMSTGATPGSSNMIQMGGQREYLAIKFNSDVDSVSTGAFDFEFSNVNAGQLNSAPNGDVTMKLQGSTGDVDGGDLIIQTTPAGASGTAQNGHATAMTVLGSGDVQIENFIGVNQAPTTTRLAVTGDSGDNLIVANTDTLNEAFIVDSAARSGFGAIDSNAKVNIENKDGFGDFNYALNIDMRRGAATTYGIRSIAQNTNASGTSIGVFSRAISGTSNTVATSYAVYGQGLMSASEETNTNIGIYGVVKGGNTNNYAVYAELSPNTAETTTGNSYALYSIAEVSSLNNATNYAGYFRVRNNTGDAKSTATFYGVYSEADGQSVGTSTTMIAGEFKAQNGDNNYAVITSGGDSGFGLSSPTAILHVQGDFIAQSTGANKIIETAESTTSLGFYGSTPITQPSDTGETSGFTAGAGTGVNDDSTFTGNVGTAAYRISDIVKALKNLGLLQDS